MKMKKLIMKIVAALILLTLFPTQIKIVSAAPFKSTFSTASDIEHVIAGTIPISDDGYIQFGYLGRSDYFSIAFILKFDSKGKILWNKTFRGAKKENPMERAYFTAVTELEDKTLIAAGTAGSDLFVVKFTASGDILWQKAYNKPDARGALGIGACDITEKESSIEIVGQVCGGGKHGQFFFLNIDTNGTIKGENIVGSYSNDSTIKHTSDGGYITLVSRLGSIWYGDLSKFDENRNREWTATIGNYLLWPAIDEVSDGFILVFPNYNKEKVLNALKFSESGEIIYKKLLADIRTKDGTSVSNLPKSTTESSNLGSYIGLHDGSTTYAGVIIGLSPEGTLTSTLALGNILAASIIDDEGELVVSSPGMFQKLNPSSKGSVNIKSFTEIPYDVTVTIGEAPKDDPNNLVPTDASIYNTFSAPNDVNYYNDKIVGFTQTGVTVDTSNKIYASAKSLSAIKGKTVQVKIYMNVDGVKKNVTSECTFKVSNKSMISVSKSGIIKGLKKGACKLTVMRKGKTIKISVTVK